MDQIQEVKQELTARSTETTVEELQRRGRKQVKVVRAQEIASMISESVQRAVEASGLLPQDEVDRLVEASRDEFRAALQQRERHAEQAEGVKQELNRVQSELIAARAELERSEQRATELRAALEEAAPNLDETSDKLEENERKLSDAQKALVDNQTALAETDRRLTDTQTAFTEAQTDLTETRKDLADAQRELANAHDQLTEKDNLIVELQGQIEAAANAPAAAPAAAEGGMSADVLFRLMNELAEVKAAVGKAPAAASGSADLSGVIEQLSGTLNERLEKFGKKIGISTAVEADAPKFDNLFRDDGPEIESNMADVKVNKKTGSGIAGNLEKLKKLKGGG